MKRKTLSPEYNLKVIFPKIAKEWDYKKNDIKPEDCTPHKKIKVWWICPKGHSYEADIGNRTAKTPMGCSYCGRKKVGYGNDLATNFPAVAKEWDYKKNDIKPNQVFPKSLKKFWWVCPKGHSYETTPASRTKPQGCPYCSGNKVGYGNDLATNFPALAKEWDYKKNDKKPTDITPSHTKKVWWICPEGHSYDMIPASRTYKNKKGQNCPYCRGMRVGQGNELIIKYPQAGKEWDFEKNSFGPDEVTFGTRKIIWWKCKKGHSFKLEVHNRVLANWSCAFCNHQKPSKEYNLKTEYPKVVKEWDYQKNKIKPEDYLPFSNVSVWWICSKKHSYKQIIFKRSNGEGCIYCASKKIGYGNDFKSNHPKIAKEWDYDKNDSRPENYFPGSHKSVWWICPKKHPFKTTIKSRVMGSDGKGTNCPYCAGQKVGYGNDLATNFPNLAKEWDFKKNKIGPSEVMPRSSTKYWWICSKGHSYETTPNSRTPAISGKKQSGSNCPYCTLTPRSKEEIYLLFELKDFFNIDEDNHKIKLDKIYDVDIVLEEEKVVIEYDGSYWHKDKADVDVKKTKKLQKDNWTVIRVREFPLKILSKKYNVVSKPEKYKETANKVLKKLDSLGYLVSDLDKYIDRKTLKNKKKADNYIFKVTKERRTKDAQIS